MIISAAIGLIACTKLLVSGMALRSVGSIASVCQVCTSSNAAKSCVCYGQAMLVMISAHTRSDNVTLTWAAAQQMHKAT